MTRTFIEVPLFSKRWKEIGLGEDELRALQIMLLKDPVSGPIMEGTGGVKSKFVCKFIFQLCGFIYATFIFKRFD